MSYRKFVGRRAFLGGAGAAIILPALASLREARGAEATKPPKRFVAWMLPNGVPMGDVGNFWKPTGSGTSFTLSRSLEPLGTTSQDVLFLSGLTNLCTYEPGAHASGAGSFLTCTKVAHTTDPAGLKNGISIDQLLAQRLKPDTRFPSLALDLAPGRGVGDCDFGLSCLYMFNISWATTSTAAPKLVEPRAIFNAMFQGFDRGASQAEVAKRALYRKSILDSAVADAKALSPRLGVADRVKLDQLVTSIRQVEQQIDQAQTPVNACVVPAEPGESIPLADRGPLMVDLQLLAMQCDLTRIMTFKLGSGFNSDDRDFGFLGLSNTHHSYSHHANDMTNIEMCIRVVRWEVGLLQRLLSGMKSIKEVDGSTLLDNAAVYASSEVSNPDKHMLTDFTALLAGKCQGAFLPGRHLQLNAAPVANLFISIAQAFGQTDSKFGDTGTGPLTGLGG